MKRLVGLVIVALALSVLAGIGAIKIQNQADARALKSLGTTKVYLAHSTIPMQTSLGDALASHSIELADFPTKFLAKDSLLEIPASIVNFVSQVKINEGQVLYRSEFAPKPSAVQSNTRGALFAGLAVLSLEIPAQNRVGGYLIPGDLVNVLSTALDRTGQMSTKSLLTNVRILAIGRSAVKGLKILDSSDVNSDLVTLAVAPSAVSTLLTSVKTGTVSLVLSHTSSIGNSK